MWAKGGRTGPVEFVERKVGSHVLYKRVENHWRKTPEYKELEFRWVLEGVTRLATLLAEEVHISDIDRALAILGGKVEPMRVSRVHPKEDSTLWPEIYNPEWHTRLTGCMATTPPSQGPPPGGWLWGGI